MIALDTNIFVYAATHGDDRGRDTVARQLLDWATTGNTIVPLQVFAEYLNVCRTRRLSSTNQAVAVVTDGFKVFRVAETRPTDLLAASNVSARYKLAFFDALICVVAQRAGATILLSEDMHDGLDAGGIRVVNPFVEANRVELGFA